MISGKLFKEVDTRAGLTGEQATKVEYVGGSVEAACALGMADGIVDLVGKSSITSDLASPRTCSFGEQKL